MTFVRTKLALERLAVGEILRIRLRDGEPRRNVPQAVRDHGHEIISLSPLTDDLYELTVRKRLLIRSTGQVKGTVRYGELEIERGGKLSGSVALIEGGD